MLKKLLHKDIVLVSRSPRRRKLLEDMGLHFRYDAVDTPEVPPIGLTPSESAVWLAEEKALAYARDKMEDTMLLITADTVVVLDGELLGKPDNDQVAIDMLQRLSGKEHKVITGVCLKDKQRMHSFWVSTDVVFKQLSPDEIGHYVKNYSPYDKAGSYGIQEWIGLVGVERIKGSYFNVMGLPTARLWEELQGFINQ